MTIETKRLYLGRSEIETGSYAQLQEEVSRLRGELRRLVDADVTRHYTPMTETRDVEYLLTESETR